VEYYPEQAPPSGESSLDANSSSSSLQSDDSVSDGEKGEKEMESSEDTTVRVGKVPSKITDALAQLGLYARSLKPGKEWFNQGTHTHFHIYIHTD
jgi:phosphatidylinositol phospholipase C delta